MKKVLCYDTNRNFTSDLEMQLLLNREDYKVDLIVRNSLEKLKEDIDRCNPKEIIMAVPLLSSRSGWDLDVPVASYARTAEEAAESAEKYHIPCYGIVSKAETLLTLVSDGEKMPLTPAGNQTVPQENMQIKQDLPQKDENMMPYANSPMPQNTENAVSPAPENSNQQRQEVHENNGNANTVAPYPAQGNASGQGTYVDPGMNYGNNVDSQQNNSNSSMGNNPMGMNGYGVPQYNQDYQNGMPYDPRYQNGQMPYNQNGQMQYDPRYQNNPMPYNQNGPIQYDPRYQNGQMPYNQNGLPYDQRYQSSQTNGQMQYDPRYQNNPMPYSQNGPMQQSYPMSNGFGNFNQINYEVERDMGNIKRPAKLTSIYSAKGGVGKTTITCNLATYLALTEHHGRNRYNVCIIDFNIDFGDVATTLGLDPNRGCMTQWANDIKQRLKGMTPENGQKYSQEQLNSIVYEESQIRNYLQRVDETGLYVLLAPISNEDSMFLTENEIEIMLNNLINNAGFDFIICDTGNNTRDSSFIPLTKADNVYMILTQSATTANDNAGFLNTMHKIGYDLNKIHILINMAMPTKSTGISVDELKEVFVNPYTKKQYHVVGIIKNYNEVRNHNNMQKPLVYNSKHEFTRCIGEIANQIIGDESILKSTGQPKWGLFGKRKR